MDPRDRQTEPLKTRIIDASAPVDSAAELSATNPTDEAANELVANFRLKRVIGHSPRGVTYLAEQLHPRQVVALKLIRAPLTSPEAAERFERDVRPLPGLNHANIARVIEADTVHTPHGPRPYFATELVRGVSLGAHVKLKKLSIPQRLDLFAQICDAVQHAHAHGLVHGDIKPNNVVVADDAGQPKLLDFGVARATDGGPTSPDPRGDVAALGRLMQDLLADGLPLRGPASDIVAKATHGDASHRCPTAGELAEDIRRNLAVSSRPTLFRRRPALLTALAIVIVFLVALALILRR